ncbi:hypothetical protein [Actinopolymorpha alba]|uniref:hypothetical protein n=1 Tax=Actinopolymorpha alba TaxID=533267 RepID=UPI00035DDA82|nr:hypothetical protein [Actinopolymorpha alba]
MATSDRRSGSGIIRYLTSTKNLIGSIGGIVGLGVTFTGIAGPYWPIVVVGLYAAGALAAPPEKVTLVLDVGEEEISRLRRDLTELGRRVGRESGRLPAGAMERFGRITAKLAGLLEHEHVGADPDVLHVLGVTIRQNLPTSLQSYLNLPRWYAGRTSVGRAPAEELLHQLELQERYVTDTASRVYGEDTRSIEDFTTYLENIDTKRSHGGELDLSGDT